MSYLQEFQTQINNRDFSKFLQLWEEYSHSDTVEAEEFVRFLTMVKNSEFAKPFGPYVESALPLWETIQNPSDSYEILKLLIDLQTTNSPLLADIALAAIHKKYPNDPDLNERLRLIGLRAKESFQGALSHYDLLAHIKEGNIVYHTGGWGTGEIMDFSPLREQMTLEFENVAGRKHINYNTAFKTLVPLPAENFLARRFADPDLLEKDAKKDPVSVVKALLRDLGPKTAAEIKDELCELVIPEKEWTKWWQATRSRIKKDTMIDAPNSMKESFRLREEALSHEDQLHSAIKDQADINEVLLATYNFVRDLPNMLKKEDLRNSLLQKLLVLLQDPTLTKSQELQILIFLDHAFNHQVADKVLAFTFQNLENIEEVVGGIEILALKKRALSLIREHRQDWAPLFLKLLFNTSQSTLKDYLLKELNDSEAKGTLESTLKDLLRHPLKSPETLVWYFQKITNKEKGSEGLPYSDKSGECDLFESFLILLNQIDLKPEYRDLLKKMYTIIAAKRFAVIRQILDGSTIEFTKEFLLLVAKCQSLSDHDIKIFRSLAEVAHPSLASGKPRKSPYDSNVIWTTEAGYFKIQERVKQIGTQEIVENAREIEAARALGDLRENSEYKFALEKRSRLQGELKVLSDQLKRARLITKDDVLTQEVSIGSIVEVINEDNQPTTYTILGPWDADSDINILSYQSKLAMSMIGLKVNDTFKFRDEDLKIVSIKSFIALDK